MNIRRRCFNAIIPVFVALALATAGLMHVLEEQQVRWGLVEESAGFAIATAEFHQQGAFDRLASGTIAPEEKQEMLAPVHRVMRNRRAERIAACSAAGDVLFDVQYEAGSPGTLALPAEVVADLRAAAATHRYLLPPVVACPTMRAFAAVRDGDGSPLGVVIADIDATSLARQTEISIARGMRCLLAALIVGFICSRAISGLLERNMRRLTLAAEEAGRGEHTTRIEHTSFIREIRDLWNTFHTTVSVLAGVSHKSRRDLLEMEAFRTDEDLSGAFREHFMPAEQMSFAGMMLSVRSFGEARAESFFALVQHGEQVSLVIGRCRLASSSLRTALIASACRERIVQLLSSRSVSEAIDELVREFKLASLQVLTVDGRTLRRQEYTPATGRVTRDDEQESGWRQRMYHDIPGELGHRLELFVEAFEGRDQAELLVGLDSIAASSGHVGGSMGLVSRTG